MFRLLSEEGKTTSHPPENTWVHTHTHTCFCVCRSLHMSWKHFLAKHLTIWEMRYTDLKVHGMYL